MKIGIEMAYGEMLVLEPELAAKVLNTATFVKSPGYSVDEESKLERTGRPPKIYALRNDQIVEAEREEEK